MNQTLLLQQDHQWNAALEESGDGRVKTLSFFGRHRERETDGGEMGSQDEDSQWQEPCGQGHLRSSTSNNIDGTSSVIMKFLFCQNVQQSKLREKWPIPASFTRLSSLAHDCHSGLHTKCLSSEFSCYGFLPLLTRLTYLKVHYKFSLTAFHHGKGKSPWKRNQDIFITVALKIVLHGWLYIVYTIQLIEIFKVFF